MVKRTAERRQRLLKAIKETKKEQEINMNEYKTIDWRTLIKHSKETFNKTQK